MENNYQNNYDKAMTLWSLGHYNKAKDILLETLENITSNIERWQLHFGLTLCYKSLEDYHHSNYYGKLACDENYQDENPFINFQLLEAMGYANYYLKNPKMALDYYEKANNYISAFDSKNLEYELYIFYFNKGRSHAEMNEFNDAIKNFQMALRYIPKLEKSVQLNGMQLVYLELGSALLNQANIAVSGQYLCQVKPKHLDKSFHIKYYLYKGIYLFDIGNYGNSIKMFKKLKSLDTNNHYRNDANMMMSAAYFHLYKFTKSTKLLYRVNEGDLKDWSREYYKLYFDSLKEIDISKYNISRNIRILRIAMITSVTAFLLYKIILYFL